MKKVAILADAWRKYLNYAWIGGCQNYLQEHNQQIDLYVYNSFGNYSQDEAYNQGEYNIFRLPNLAEFDGVILELNNIENQEIKEEILAKATKAKVPVITIGEELKDCVYVGPDNYKAVFTMVEHVIREHGCKKLNFIGASEGNLENNLRYKAFRDALLKYNIPFDTRRAYFGDFSIATGEQAFAYFMEQGLQAEAYICINDNVAVGLCYKASDYGLQAPGDFLVTGFDNFDKAEYFVPRISTIDVVREEMAYKALALLCHIWDGKAVVPVNYVDTVCKFSESCGCVAQNPKDRGAKIVDMMISNDHYELMQTRIQLVKKELINCNSFGEMIAYLKENMQMLRCEDFCLMINQDILEEVDGETDLFYGEVNKAKYNRKGYPTDMACLYPKGDFFAEETRGNQMYLFSPLHFRDRQVGYIAVSNWNYASNAQLWFECVNVLQEAMEQVHHRVVLDRLNAELSNLYLKDTLTGLYNRVAYGRLAQPMFDKYKKNKKPLAIMFVDLDRLKYINDTFGHDMGNVAIKAIADAMLMSCPRKSILMRYGGDEFVAFVPVSDAKKAEELKQKILASVKRRNQELNTGFMIDASIGYAVTTESKTLNMNDYINLADERMYEEKKEKKANRI